MDTNAEYKRLFDNLYEGKLIYHERVTMLCELVNYELTDDSFRIELKAIKSLNIEYDYQQRIFDNLTSKSTFEISGPFKFNNKISLKGNTIGCGFLIFADPIIVKQISLSTEEKISAIVYNLLSP